MARLDRREKMALDESYNYYRQLEQKGDNPELYRLARCLKTMNVALCMGTNGHFKLTRQLWKRVQQGLFDKLINHFPGYLLVTSEEGKQIEPKTELPDAGIIEFHPQGCRRADDIFRMEIKHLYPGTLNCLAKVWSKTGAMLNPDDFASGQECSQGLCPMKPMVLGDEVLGEESQNGKSQAYHYWWELFWQAYCSHDKQERNLIRYRMDELESVWGNLYY